VARTLERQWEEALLAQRSLEEEYRRFQQTQPVQLSPAERAQIEALARDLPALWEARTTSVVEKRQVVRLLLQRVVVWSNHSDRQMKVQLHWTGGTVTEHQLSRAVRGWDQVADAATVWQRVQGWHAAGWTARRMADELNAAGYRTPHDRRFTAESVRQFLTRGGPRPARASSPAGGCQQTQSRERASK